MDRAQAPAAITAAAVRYGVPPALALAVANAESGINPNVRDGGAGEIGIFQLMPKTAAWLGVASPRDAEANIDGGVRFLSYLLTKYNGDARLALTAYNGGEGNIARGTTSPEARAYAERVLQSAGGAEIVAAAAAAVPAAAADWSWLPAPVFSAAAVPNIPIEAALGLLLASGAYLAWRA